MNKLRTQTTKEGWVGYLKEVSEDQRQPLKMREKAAQQLIAMEQPQIKLRFTFYRVP